MSPFTVYIDQETEGMYLLRDDAEDTFKLSHSDFIAGDWLTTLPLAQKDLVELVVELAHAVSSVKSPAQRFTDEQWKKFYQKCATVGKSYGCEIRPMAWPERTTPNARRFTYGSSEKATKNSGTHDVKAMRVFHRARPHLRFMRLDAPRHRTHPAIREAAVKHREQMNFELLRLKNRKYPMDHPWMQQCSEAVEKLALLMTERQRAILGVEFSKRDPGKINKSWNKPKVATLWALTHNLDGTVRTDDRGRPVSHAYLRHVVDHSPYRPRHCGVHRANIMNDARASFIANRLGIKNPKLDQLVSPAMLDDFVDARNEFDREWLKLTKLFRDYGDA